MAPQEQKSRKPANTAFKQQRLKAWQPILTPKTVLPTFFIVGVIFAPLGGLLLYASDSVSEISIDYTHCDTATTSFTSMPGGTVKSSLAQGDSSAIDPLWKLNQQTCSIKFNIPSQLKNSVFIYYRLTNFFQNHRRYVKSFDAKQLSGEAVSAGSLNTGCSPLAQSNNMPYYPCGLIANSQFNDTISSPMHTGDNETYVFSSKGIAWPSDRQKYGPTKYDLSQVLPPPNWKERYPNGYDKDPDLQNDEHFQVWMRTAGLPDFRKLYGRNDTQPMKAGTYQIDIKLSFPVTEYGGTKSIVISTVSFLGGKNPFLGIAYIAVGIVCVVLGCLFTARHLYKPRKLGDHTYLSWNQNSGPDGVHRD